MKKAYVFPGQGSQFPGMGKTLYENTPQAREMMEKANSILGFRITDIMFDGSDEDLRATKVTQPSIYILSSLLAKFTPSLSAPDMVAGHSLGEFSALAACGAISFEDGLKLVAIRANEMQKCCESHPGTMAAIIGLSDEKVIEVCSKINAPDSLVVPANFNCGGQVVISGSTEGIEKACEAMREAGAKRALPLSVSGAFHSPLMEDARTALAEAIERTEIRKPLCPIYQNVTATAETDPGTIKKNLLLQLTSPVRWTGSVNAMIGDGAVSFTEIGPGQVLQGLIKRISSGMEGISIQGIQ